jgi:hypothetical protein
MLAYRGRARPRVQSRLANLFASWGSWLSYSHSSGDSMLHISLQAAVQHSTRAALAACKGSNSSTTRREAAKCFGTTAPRHAGLHPPLSSRWSNWPLTGPLSATHHFSRVLRCMLVCERIIWPVDDSEPNAAIASFIVSRQPLDLGISGCMLLLHRKHHIYPSPLPTQHIIHCHLSDTNPSFRWTRHPPSTLL